jgi:hypothetical protein
VPLETRSISLPYVRYTTIAGGEFNRGWKCPLTEPTFGKSLRPARHLGAMYELHKIRGARVKESERPVERLGA